MFWMTLENFYPTNLFRNTMSGSLVPLVGGGGWSNQEESESIGRVGHQIEVLRNYQATVDPNATNLNRTLKKGTLVRNGDQNVHATNIWMTLEK